MTNYTLVKIDSELIKNIDNYTERTSKFQTRSAFIHFYLTEAIEQQYSEILNKIKTKLKGLKSKYDLTISLYPRFSYDDINELVKTIKKAIKQYNDGPKGEKYGRWQFQPLHSLEPKAAVEPKYNDDNDSEVLDLRIEIIP